jgi:hypothetical protein
MPKAIRAEEAAKPGETLLRPTSEQASYRTFRRAIVLFLGSRGDLASPCSIHEIEAAVCGDVVASSHGSIELDTMSLIHEGLLETTEDSHRVRLSDLGKEFYLMMREGGSSPS